MEQVTIREIARMCGVGVSTVSRALNGHPDVNAQTREKIMQAVREYHYVPNNSARNLKMASSRTIAVLAKGIANPFFGPMIRILESETARAGYSFALQHVDEGEDEMEAAIRLEKEKRLKGIIFLGGLSRHSKQQLQLLSVPFVVSTVPVQLPGELEACACVSIDDELESYRMTEYLIGLGHRDIAILAASAEDESIGESRLGGYRRALSDHGIPCREELIVRMRPDHITYSMPQGYEVTKTLIESGRKFTCLYAISDTLAIGACRALFDAGLRVPEDVSVAGFDGLEAASYYNPVITTIRQPGEEIAAETIRLLLAMIDGKTVGKQHLFRAELCEGGSTAAPA